MSSKHIFKDEWLVKAAAEIPGVTPLMIDDTRSQRAAYLSEDLIKSDAVTKELLYEAVSKVYDISCIDLDLEFIDKLALSLIPEKVCLMHQMLAFKVGNEFIEVAMADPTNLIAKNDVRAVSGREPQAWYCMPSRIQVLLTELFDPDTEIFDLLKTVGEDAEVEILQSSEGSGRAQFEKINQPIIKLVDSLISKAVRMGASDIHIEHEDTKSLVRFRVDGLLKNIMILPKHIGNGPVVSRIKIMANVDVADHMRPQDGRAKLLVRKQEIGLRVSVLPTSFGEKVVMRILNPKAANVPFEKLGFKPEIAAKLRKAVQNEQGIVLVTGPTGSGKTTSLYSILNMIKNEDTNIVTIEDPVEYRLDGINQVQVLEKQGLTFAAALRSILRQDPDVILVGEIRDPETAEIAFQSAMTGHLVFSTLHTNDTISSLTRLMDMGIERFKITPGLLAITAQRLVRRLCPDCKQPVAAENTDPDIMEMLKRNNLAAAYYVPVGCAKCDYDGHRGRLSVLEFLEIDQEMKKHIAAGDTEDDLRKFALARGALWTMAADALWHLSVGDTSVEEVVPHVHFGYSAKAEAQKSLSASAVPAPAQKPPDSARRRILVVDDDVMVRIVIRKCLEQAGHAVDEAANGAEAVNSIKTSKPDLMFLDLMMPEMDGYSVIEAVRKLPAAAVLPIIVITAVSDDAIHEKVINLGADDYMVKPFNLGLVVARVNALFRRMA